MKRVIYLLLMVFSVNFASAEEYKIEEESALFPLGYGWQYERAQRFPWRWNRITDELYFKKETVLFTGKVSDDSKTIERYITRMVRDVRHETHAKHGSDFNIVVHSVKKVYEYQRHSGIPRNFWLVSVTFRLQEIDEAEGAEGGCGCSVVETVSEG